MTKSQEISRRILEKLTSVCDRDAVNPGVDAVREAFDFVLGAGAYDKLAGDVYDQLTGASS